MNIAIVQIIGSYIDQDVEYYMYRLGHKVSVIDLKRYRGSDLYHNPELEKKLRDNLHKGSFGLIYSSNFFPLLAKRCNEIETRYLAWHYDTPPHLPTEQYMDCPTNVICFFNRKDYEHYHNRGLDTVHYVPLAVNTDRLKSVVRQEAKYKADVSLVGQLYQSTLPGLRNQMNDIDSGWIDGIIQVQSGIYGSYFVPELITDERLESINNSLKKKKLLKEKLNGRQLSFSIASYLTYLDRVSLLSLLSKRYQTDLYSERFDRTERDLLKNIRYKGTVDYNTEMPLVFYNSKINLCPIIRNNEYGIPLRALDVMGCDGFLLANFQPGLAECFENEKELVMYQSIEEAVELASFYLAHEAEKQKIAQNGLERVEKDFRYEDRIEQMMKKCGF